MSELSYFESSHGNVTCSAEEFFAFVTDIRNFEQFIPANTISNFKADKEQCSFSVSMLGTVSVRLEEKEPYAKVVFSGDALKKNDFLLTVKIADGNNGLPDVQVILSADLNPMMKMVAVKPIRQFLEMLVHEMENFRGWKETKE
jgi:hypothetical protein